MVLSNWKVFIKCVLFISTVKEKRKALEATHSNVYIFHSNVIFDIYYKCCCYTRILFNSIVFINPLMCPHLYDGKAFSPLQQPKKKLIIKFNCLQLAITVPGRQLSYTFLCIPRAYSQCATTQTYLENIGYCMRTMWNISSTVYNDALAKRTKKLFLQSSSRILNVLIARI